MWLSNSSIGRKVVMSVTGSPVSYISHVDEPGRIIFGGGL